MVGVRPDRLELADSVHVVEPRKRVRRDRAVGRFDDAVELLAGRPRPRVRPRRRRRGNATGETPSGARRHAMRSRVPRPCERRSPSGTRGSSISSSVTLFTRIHGAAGSCARPCASSREIASVWCDEHEHLARPGPVEDLVEQLRPLGADLPLELDPAGQPAPARRARRRRTRAGPDARRARDSPTRTRSGRSCTSRTSGSCRQSSCASSSSSCRSPSRESRACMGPKSRVGR